MISENCDNNTKQTNILKESNKKTDKSTIKKYKIDKSILRKVMQNRQSYLMGSNTEQTNLS